MSNEHDGQAREIVTEFQEHLRQTYDVISVGARSWLTQRVIAALSSRDTEIREVLERLQNLPTGEPMCWCRVRWQSGEHDGACEQARSLYASLQPPEKKFAG